MRGGLPETPIAFVSVNPTPARWAQAEKHRETNRLIREYVAGKKGLAFIDVWDERSWDRTVGPARICTVRDRLHPNAAGYKIPRPAHHGLPGLAQIVPGCCRKWTTEAADARAK